MARSVFGGFDSGALAINPPVNSVNYVKSAPNILGGTAWDSPVGGVQYTDLVLVDGVTATTARTDANGYVKVMYGPDGVNEGMWVDLGSGSRFWLRTTDPLGPVVDAKIETQAAVDSSTYAGLSGDNVLTGKQFFNGESWAPSLFDVDLMLMGAVRYNPIVQTTGFYVQHRVSGDLGAKVQEAGCSELRISNATNPDFLIGHEATTVITGGVNAITDLRGIDVSSHYEGTPSGTITAYAGIRVQNQAAPTGTITIGTAYGLYVEQQTQAAVNYSIYAPTGKTVLGSLDTNGSIAMGSSTTTGVNLTMSTTTGTNPSIYWVKGGANRWINWTSDVESGSNTGSNITWIARDDAGGNLGAALTLTRATKQVTTGAALLVTGGVGFNGTTPIAKRATTADSTDLASVITLANALKADLVAYGLKS